MDKILKKLKEAYKVSYDASGTYNFSNYVPFATLNNRDVSLVGKAWKNHHDTKDRYYGYKTLEQAIERIEKAKKLPGYSDATSFYVALYDEHNFIISYIDENGKKIL
jgi:hypothetical protein